MMNRFFSRLLGGSPPPAAGSVSPRAPGRPVAPAPHGAPDHAADEASGEEEADDGLVAWFTGDHRACDTDWADVEGASNAGGDVAAAFARFDAHLRRHLGMEEEVLFPAFEEASGMAGGGPTYVMRAEHVQMRGLLDEMSRLARAGEHQALIEQGDTLMMLIQQHNVKEENMLYPMAEQFLGRGWAGIKGKLARF